MSTESPGLPPGVAAPTVRRRDTVLAALETFRAIGPALTLNNLAVFLYVAENEGLSIGELAVAAGLTHSTASRSVRSLAGEADRWSLPPYLGLVRLDAQGPARNSRTVWLTPGGRALCTRIERHIAEAVPIGAAAPLTLVSSTAVADGEGASPGACASIVSRPSVGTESWN